MGELRRLTIIDRNGTIVKSSGKGQPWRTACMDAEWK